MTPRDMWGIARDAGWRALLVDAVTLVAITGALYGLTVIASGMVPA